MRPVKNTAQKNVKNVEEVDPSRMTATELFRLYEEAERYNGTTHYHYRRYHAPQYYTTDPLVLYPTPTPATALHDHSIRRRTSD
jgi:hypothetical protein